MPPAGIFIRMHTCLVHCFAMVLHDIFLAIGVLLRDSAHGLHSVASTLQSTCTGIAHGHHYETTLGQVPRPSPACLTSAPVGLI